MYVVKSGYASVYVKLKLIFEDYVAKKTKRFMSVYDKILDLCRVDDSVVYNSEERKFKERFTKRFQRFFFENNKESKEKYVYFKLETLSEGKMFGAHSLMLNDSADDSNKTESTLLLVSEGCDCILVNRIVFQFEFKTFLNTIN
jgi:hypothetical protein